MADMKQARKALFGIIRLASRQPVLDVIKLVKYRPDFYGAPMQKVTHEAMRGALGVVRGATAS